MLVVKKIKSCLDAFPNVVPSEYDTYYENHPQPQKALGRGGLFPIPSDNSGKQLFQSVSLFFYSDSDIDSSKCP